MEQYGLPMYMLSILCYLGGMLLLFSGIADIASSVRSQYKRYMTGVMCIVGGALVMYYFMPPILQLQKYFTN